MASRAEVAAKLAELTRQMSALGLVTADRLGLIAADLRCLAAAGDEPGLTAGRLAELTGLSTSATTAALDRLEKRGLVARTRDDTDRRRVSVESTGRHEAETARPLAAASRALLAGYDEDQLALLLDFVTRLTEAHRTILAQPPHPSLP